MGQNSKISFDDGLFGKLANGMMLAKTRAELFKKIFEQLGTLFTIEDIGLCVLNREGTHWQDWAVSDNYFDTEENRILHLDGMSGYHPLDSLNKMALKGTGIISKEEIKQSYKDVAFYDYLISGPILEFMYTPLVIGGKTIGVIWLDAFEKGSYSPDMFPLFEQISTLVALAISNILAKEELYQREMENALQVEIYLALSKNSEWNGPWSQVISKFQLFISFDFILIELKDCDNDKYCSFERIGKDEYRLITLESFLGMNNISVGKYNNMSGQFNYDRNVIRNAEDFIRYSNSEPINGLIKRNFKVKSNLFYSLSLENGGKLIISFYSRHIQCYSTTHLDFLERLSHTLSLTMERLLTYEHISFLNLKLGQEKEYLEEEIINKFNQGEIIGQSTAIKELFKKIDIVKKSDTTILIVGETGTGKELVARALHNYSNRKSNSLIKVNCAALPKELVESELFGHEKGAFTGAIQKRIGKFELSSGGAIFLDEVGELQLDTQAKLLRVLQEKEIERVGGNGIIKIDTRIIAATNKNLELEVAKGNFRSDLYYRLLVFPITLPPLRERKEDLPLLTEHFLKIFSKKHGKTIKHIKSRDLKIIENYDWPGNVRELEHIIERSVLITNGHTLDFALNLWDTQFNNSSGFKFNTLKEAETNLILETLKRCGGIVSGPNGAAEILGVPPTTLDYRIKRAGIAKENLFKKHSAL